MPQVTVSDLPRESALHAHIGPGDFMDCYKVRADIDPQSATQTLVSFPGWAKALVVLRGIVTAPFGLSQSGPAAGEKYGPFLVHSSDEHEVIAGFDDKHLDFRVSVFSKDGFVYLATWVHPNNVGGRVYLRLIMPFHVMIARNGLARIAAQAKRARSGQAQETGPLGG